MNEKKIVVYTAIFGSYDKLIEPKVIPENCDFVCFTDSDIKSGNWRIIKSEPIPGDSVRSARKRKILAHRYLREYEYSVWIDGNLEVIGDVNELIEKYLQNVNMAVFDHEQNKYNPGYNKLEKLFHAITFYKFHRDNIRCLYKEYEHLLYLNKMGKNKEDDDIMRRQVEYYKSKGYPKNNGQLVSMAMLRRHNEPDVVKSMEDWWKELKRFSRRDQLSFNYVAWKNNLKFVYMKGDSRRNKYFWWYKHKKN